MRAWLPSVSARLNSDECIGEIPKPGGATRGRDSCETRSHEFQGGVGVVVARLPTREIVLEISRHAVEEGKVGPISHSGDRQSVAQTEKAYDLGLRGNPDLSPLERGALGLRVKKDTSDTDCGEPTSG